MTKFTDITLPEPLQRAAADLNYITPTSIQEQAIPWLIENDRDLIALAQTGTGKTAAFGFPLISKTDIEKKKVQTLILCPTRELCLQISSDLESYAKYLPRIKTAAIYGGASIIKQKDALKAGVQIVVGTPGRVYDMINQGALHVEDIERLILDEADEMLNMGFKEELFNIMSHTPEQKQVMLFSATMSADILKISSTFMTDPHKISVGSENQGADNIQHFYYKVQARDKYLALKRIADMSPEVYGIVFCRTRTETQEIANKLQHDGYNADALHGDLSQGQRELVMNRFRSKYVRLLIATDVAARGLDVDDLTHIINYHLPVEPEIYIHRSGRTGRAGKSGISISIIHTKELGALKNVERRLGREIVFSTIPTGIEICEKQLFHFIDTVEGIEVKSEQIDAFLPKLYKKLGWLSREELIQRFVAVEFNRFLAYYKDNRDLSQEGIATAKKDKSEIVFKTFKLSIGYEHEIDKRELMRYVNRLRVARSIEIGQIDIFETHSLIELDSDYEKDLLKAISRSRLNGVDIEVEIYDGPKPRSRTSTFDPNKRSERPSRPASDRDDSRGDKPRRSYSSESSDRPRKSYGDSSDKPRRSYSDSSPDKRSDSPRKSYGDSSDRPRRSYSDSSTDKRSDTPRKSYGDSSDRPRRSYSDSSPDKRSDAPRKSYSADGYKSREAGSRRPAANTARTEKTIEKAKAHIAPEERALTAKERRMEKRKHLQKNED